MLESPHLVFKLKAKGGKPHHLLVSSDYERNDWRETINGLKSKGNKVRNLTVVDLQNQINSLSVCIVHSFLQYVLYYERFIRKAISFSKEMGEGRVNWNINFKSPSSTFESRIYGILFRII